MAGDQIAVIPNTVRNLSGERTLPGEIPRRRLLGMTEFEAFCVALAEFARTLGAAVALRYNGAGNKLAPIIAQETGIGLFVERSV